ncbi:trypsin-like peptidase domain-containing protein [Pseudoxanthomonas sp. YR558]|nr:trypsin-like peptidase domain-containing protein [Pseudoxanthomonas sp. YR558]PPJ42216.1 serine protease [Pseudoxanthomonas sp. KAs_5_3]SFV28159.1 hypothetical protein SAMN05428990_0908 [Pseudoxanthomonas sp. YR558]
MRSNTLRCLASAMLVFLPLAASAAVTQVTGEVSRTPSQAAPTWKLAQFPARNVIRQGYRELAIERLVELERNNTSQRIKATQIGVGRALATEGIERMTPALRWVPLASGGAVARLQIGSPDALGLRIGLQVKGLHPHVELRFAGVDEPGRVVASVTAAEAQSLADDQGLYWTPATDGDAQIIEIYRPAHVKLLQARLQAPQVSHLLTNSRNDFKIVKALGDSGACNINAVCRVDQLGPAYVQAKNAVAHMVFSTGGKSYVCTGTLINDTTPSTQVPYFYSAAHCIGDQTVANTLNTYWGYENTGCNVTNGVRTNPLTGGADLLFVDTASDALLLRLRNPAPASATFAGWDASPVALNADVVAIHHPAGDAKKVSFGKSVAGSPYPERFAAGWLEGTTEGGSSGSGLFTRYADNSYRLRGGLYGGWATCANSGNLNNAENRDFYSRLDLIFPQIKQWIAADPVLERSSQPLVRNAGATAGVPAQGQGARAAGTTDAPVSPAPSTSAERVRKAPLRTNQRER